MMCRFSLPHSTVWGWEDFCTSTAQCPLSILTLPHPPPPRMEVLWSDSFPASRSCSWAPVSVGNGFPCKRVSVSTAIQRPWSTVENFHCKTQKLIKVLTGAPQPAGTRGMLLLALAPPGWSWSCSWFGFSLSSPREASQDIFPRVVTLEMEIKDILTKNGVGLSLHWLL